MTSSRDVARPPSARTSTSGGWSAAALLCAVVLIASAPRAPAAVIPCLGDCNGDAQVTIDDLVKGVTIALETAAVESCPAFDLAGDGAVTVDEVVKAVDKALTGCLETIALPGLPAGVEVVYDSIGIPHIYGPDLNSVTFAQGYVHAALRFFQLDVSRHWAQGRLTELFGPVTLRADVAMRTFFTSRDGRRLHDAMWERLQATDPEVTAQLEAYADGVNAWLADLRAGRNGATLPPEYASILINLGPDDIPPWRPQDSVAIHFGAWSGSWLVTNTLLYQELSEALDDATFRDVVRVAPAVSVPVVSSAEPMLVSPLAAPAAVTHAQPQPGVAKAVRRLLDEVARTSPFGGDHPGTGSNNWAIAPSLSASGSAMLASDPHVTLSNPSNYFLQQIDVESGPAMRVSGAAVVGLPYPVHGFSEHGAWAGTAALFDNLDVYVETVTTPPDYPASPRTVLFNGRQVPVLRVEEQFTIKNRSPRTFIIEVVPHHGPMLPDPVLGDAVVGLAATGMTMRWTGQEMHNLFRTYLGMMRARNAAEFRAALRNPARDVYAFNLVWADVHGDIMYMPYALLPQRPAGTVPYAPLPGTGEAEWLTDADGNLAWVPEDQFPHALNPAEGFIATANSDPTGHTFDNDPLNDGPYFAAWYYDGFREQRTQDMLSNRAHLRPPGARISAADMSAYQYDTSSPDAVRLLPFLFAAAAARPELLTAKMADAVARLRAWAEEKPGSPACDALSGLDAHDLRADVPPRAQPVSDEERQDAVTSSLYHAWVKQIWTVLPTPAWDPWQLVLHLLEDLDQTDPAYRVYTKGANGDSTLWDDPATAEVETHTEVLLAALSRALDLLEQKFGSADMHTWLWGKLHQAQLEHSIPGSGLGQFAAPGGFWTVNVASPGGWAGTDPGDFTFLEGPSQRMIVQLDPAGIKAVNVMPGGENGNPGSAEAFTTINPATHYGDMMPKWINGETVEMRISRQDVAADNQRHVQFVPAGE